MELVQRASAHYLVDRKDQKFIQPTADIFNEKEPRIKEDIIRMILQYLHNEGYQTSRMTLHDEANMKFKEFEEQQMDLRRLRKFILEGDWSEIDRISQKPFIKNQKAFLYAIYKQQYLEYIEHHEIQKAFNFLNKRLKPFEQLQATAQEFKDLCYLLTCKSITDAPSFRNWEGLTSSREKLAEQLQSMIAMDAMTEEDPVYVPPDRLLTLLRQAVAYQIEFSQYHPFIAPKIATLLQDYQSLIIPNQCLQTLQHHQSVKCVEWIGEKGDLLASGSNDHLIRLWKPDGQLTAHLAGHESKIWDMSSPASGAFLASAGADETIRIWDLSHTKYTNSSVLTGHSGDIYSVKIHPNEKHLVSGGYDRVLKLYDIETSAILKTFSGHSLAVSTVIFNPFGNLVVSGSRDNTIRFWDLTSGLCIKTISSHLGDVTSVEMNSSGAYLLSSSKDNSIRLWDIRMIRPVKRYKGHQNTCKNFIKASFACYSLICSGSEDGRVHIWDMEKGDLIQKLEGHAGVVYGAFWHPKQAKWASCSDDHTVKIWYYNDQAPMYSK